MRLLDKYDSIEAAATALRDRYDRAHEVYCRRRQSLAKNRTYELFWTNMCYLYGLMKETAPRRFV